MATETEQMAQTIKTEMQKRGWSLVDLSTASSIPPRRLAERLTGLTDFHLSELSALARAFDMSLAELIEPVAATELAA